MSKSVRYRVHLISGKTTYLGSVSVDNFNFANVTEGLEYFEYGSNLFAKTDDGFIIDMVRTEHVEKVEFEYFEDGERVG